jgi:hypothetical protein
MVWWQFTLDNIHSRNRVAIAVLRGGEVSNVCRHNAVSVIY